MPVPLSTDQYLSDADKRLTKQDDAQQRADLVSQNAQKWFDAYDKLPKNDADLDKEVSSMLSTTEARSAFHNKMREQFFKQKDFAPYKQQFDEGDAVVRSQLAPKYKEYYTSQMPAYKQAEYDKQKALVTDRRQTMIDTIGTYIKAGGTLTDAEDIPTNETPEQKAAVNKGLAYNKTFAQAVEETKKSGVFQGMSNETATDRWGGEGPSFQQQEDLDKAIAAETNPEFKAVLSELQSNWKRERIGSPTYQNAVLDKLQKLTNLATSIPSAGLKTLQNATTKQRTENENANSGNTVPNTVYGINPSLAAEQVVKHPIDAAKDFLGNAFKSVKESTFGGSTDSSANLGGIVAESNKQAPRNNEFVGSGFGTNPGLMQDITQTVLPNPFGPEFKAAKLAGSVVGKGLGLAKDVVAGTEAGAKALGTVEEAAQMLKTAFTRNAADKALGKAFGIAKGDEVAGQKLGQTLEAAKEYGVGQKERFLAEKTGAPEYAAQIVKQESAGEHAFFTLNKAGLAKGTNSLTAAAKTAEVMTQQDGIARSVVSHPDVVRAFSKLAGKEVNHVVMPTQYVEEMKAIVGSATKSPLLNNKNAIVQGAVKAMVTLNKEVYQPINNITRNFYLSRPSTAIRNLVGNTGLQAAMDVGTFRPEVVGQLAKHFGGELSDAQKAEEGIQGLAEKAFTRGEVNDWLHNHGLGYGLKSDVGRYGTRGSSASKLNPLRYAEKVSNVVSQPAYVASQGGDTASKINIALSEMKRVKDLGPESSGQILKHVEEVIGLQSRMNSKVDKMGKTATFAWSWNGAVLPNLLKAAGKDGGKGLQNLYRLEELKQAEGQRNAKNSDRPALLSTAIDKYDLDKIYGEQSKLKTSPGSKEVVMANVETPLSTPSQFFNQGADESARGVIPLGYRTIIATLTGIDPETDKSVDKSIQMSYDVKGAISRVNWVGDRLKLGAYTATGPAYKAFKDLIYLYKNRNEPENMIDTAIKFRTWNNIGANPLETISIGKPRYRQTNEAFKEAQQTKGASSFQEKARVDE